MIEMAIKRVDVALNCTDLKASIDFYSRFFATAPTKIKEDYAKFELTNPNLHFSLNVLPFEKFGVLSHLGFQVDHAEDVFAMGEHLRQANLLN
jgi:catechol 2,3-dioxygenase-like lactoylglutathione lyase family enzyme